MTITLLGLIKSGVIYGQDINIKIGFRDSIKSEILHENRKILIHLPDDYDTSKKLYPVLYLLGWHS
jgi:predicted alpha/beta superfamily hydrolase